MDCNGVGSELALPNLTLMKNAGTTGGGGYPHRIQALNGGRVDLHSVTAIVNGYLPILADGNNSRIDFSSMTSLTATSSSLEARNHGSILFGGVTPPSSTEGILIGLGGHLTIGGTVAFNSPLVIQGSLDTAIDGVLDIHARLEMNDSSRLAGPPGGKFQLSGNLLGGTRNADLYNPQGTVTFNGTGTARRLSNSK